MAQQTAVEWLQECLDLHLNHEQKMQYEGLFQQAKQMEKGQIMKAYKAHHDLGHIYGLETEQYYNETYMTNKNNNDK